MTIADEIQHAVLHPIHDTRAAIPVTCTLAARPCWRVHVTPESMDTQMAYAPGFVKVKGVSRLPARCVLGIMTSPSGGNRVPGMLQSPTPR